MSDEVFHPSTGREVFEVSMCGGKDAFRSPQLAHRRLREMAKKSRYFRAKKGKRSLVAYRCRVCNQWHLGNA